MSHLAWIDFDRDAQRAAREMMAQLNAPEARDELGLGTVRDGLADLLFPGTSTIQTRVHYMLFIPWIWGLAARKTTPTRRVDHARTLEFKLAEALAQSEDTNGIIGRVAGRKLKRLPSGVYWSGLERWGIRCGSGSPERTLRADRQDGLWADDLPDPPDGFPETASFDLREEDAAFLRDRIVAGEISSRSVLAELAVQGREFDAERPWEIEGMTFSPVNQHLLTLARTFAQGMHGASLLYNLIAAERVVERPNAAAHDGADTLAEDYAAQIKSWAEEVNFDAMDPVALYDAVRRTGRNPNIRLKDFIAEWIARARLNPAGIAENHDVRDLIVRRERQIKPHSTARLSSDAALDRWGGASGAYMLEYRWGTARRFLKDLSDAR